MNATKIDIAIISYNSRAFNLRCINSIYETKGNIPVSIILVDNASEDDSANAVKEKFPEVEVIENDKNLGYAKAVNIGVENCDGHYVIVCNADIEFRKGTLTAIKKYLENSSDVGVVGVQQVYPDGSWQRSYGDLPGIKLGLKNLFFISKIQDSIKKFTWKPSNKTNGVKEVGYIDGALHAINKRAFEQVKGYDEDYFFYTEESDFCYKIKRNGYKAIFLPSAQIIHHRGGSSAEDRLNAKNVKALVSSKVLFCKKRLGFQEGKFYILCEIFSSANSLVLWRIIQLLTAGTKRKKAKRKAEIHKMFFNFWLDEFNEFIKES